LNVLPQLGTTLLERISDTLRTDAELPTEESELSADATLNEVLLETIAHASRFDSQVSMFEATGTLLSLLYRDPESQRAIFRNLVQPILNQMDAGLQLYRANPNPPSTDTRAIATILTLHHDITALGHIAKGFPDMPSNPHEGYIPPPIPVFQQSVEAILASLDTLNHFKIIRDAVSSGICSMFSL
jgi:exportin-T